mgnify:CR=1 FL=1|tara:strand:+ start:396 stop:587 length:192 start_codon:yes stop_codon:yes gene_type:complete
MLPNGLSYLDSWLSTDGTHFFQLMETDNARIFDDWTRKWDDLVEFEIVSVNDSPTTNEPEQMD